MNTQEQTSSTRKRDTIVAGNWKMNLDIYEADELLDNLVKALEENDIENTKVIVCPPAIYLEMAIDYSDNSYFYVGAQNVSEHSDGAYTGEISAKMLYSMKLDYCIVGHSERREYFRESNQQIAQKVDKLLELKINPIVCCGEKLDARESNKHFEVVKQQIEEGLFNLTADQIAKIVIAYEPVWAIGTGKTATPDQAQEMHAFIRKLLRDQYGEDVAESISILYGGSCKPGNAKELFANPDVDGGLIGGASLKIDDFLAIIKATQK